MKGRKLFLLVILLLEWPALVAQLLLHLQAASTGTGESLIRFFSYFTILTNAIVAVYATVLWLRPMNKQAGFFFRPTVETAITLYITVVGLIYNLLLRHLWNSAGLQAVIHDVLHTIIPLLILIYWWKWVDARRLPFNDIPLWLVYPAIYAIIVVIRGHFSGWYPYPFLNALQYGYTRIMINSSLLLVTFLLFSFAFVLLGKRKKTPALL